MDKNDHAAIYFISIIIFMCILTAILTHKLEVAEEVIKINNTTAKELTDLELLKKHNFKIDKKLMKNLEGKK